MILIHPSSLGKLMATPQSGPADNLSKGAISYCLQLAKEQVYGFKQDFSPKETDKGTICENESIELLNNVRFTNYSKNIERRTNKWLTGECDIIVPSVKTIDIKSSWSLATFPVISTNAHKPDYEWQGRAYMQLWDVPLHEVAFVMVSTPDELIGYEPEELHSVDHLPEELRITSITYERDKEKEQLMIHKCELAQKQVLEFINKITMEHAA